MILLLNLYGNYNNNCGDFPLDPLSMKKSLYSYGDAVISRYNQVTTLEMEKRREEMKREYSGSSRVSYHDRVTQCAYIKYDTPFHALAIAHLIANYPFLIQIFNQPQVDIVSIGCGPGSDMLGILHFLFQTQQLPFVRFLLMDANPGWVTSIDSFDHLIKTNRPFGPFFDQQFCPTNIAQPYFPYYQIYNTCDIFIFSMILSEIAKEANDSEIQNTKLNICGLVATAKPGAYFLIIDLNCGFMNDIICVLEDTIFKFSTQSIFKFRGEVTFNSEFDKYFENSNTTNWKPKGKSNLVACMYQKFCNTIM